MHFQAFSWQKYCLPLKQKHVVEVRIVTPSKIVFEMKPRSNILVSFLLQKPRSLIGTSKNRNIYCVWLFHAHLTRPAFYSVTSDFTRLIMQTNSFWYNLICPHVVFQNDRTMWTVASHVKKSAGGGKENVPCVLVSGLYWTMFTCFEQCFLADNWMVHVPNCNMCKTGIEWN